MAVALRYFTDFGKPAFQHNRVDLWRNLCTSLLYFVLRVRCGPYGSSRSLSHLLMSFLLNLARPTRYSIWRSNWIGLNKVQRPTRHILVNSGHFGDGGVTTASARIVAAAQPRGVCGVE